MKDTCYVITGPTASGKSALALNVAERCGGELICMDSMQIYRGMDIGTAKPTIEEQRRIPHHMLDIVSPDEEFSVSMYREMAEAIAQDVLRRGKIPVFCGGTGFYLRALRHPELMMGNTPADPVIRAALEKEASTPDGKHDLHVQLEQVDPQTAERLHENDVRRVIRALEVYKVTGIPFSMQSQKMSPVSSDRQMEYRVICLNMERSELYARINRRVDEMMEAGLLSEVRRLLESGISPQAQAMQGIGYKELVPFLQGMTELDSAIDLIKQNTRHYAKRQLTWMRRETEVLWLDSRSDILDSALMYFTDPEGKDIR